MDKRIIKLNLMDYSIAILVIFIFAWDPNFAHGYIAGLDEGTHLPWINEILLGRVPYKQIYIIWGPFSQWLPSIFMKIAGISLANLRLFYHISRLFTLILGFIVLRQFLKTRLFSYIGVWLLVATKVSDFWSSRWGSTRLLFALLAVYLVILCIKYNKKYLMFLSGIFSGIALFNSQETGIFCIFAVLLTLSVYRKYLAGILFQYVFGLMAVVLPVCIYFALNGAFTDFIKISFVDIVTVYPRVRLQTRFNPYMLKALYLYPGSFFAIRLSYFLLSAAILFIGFGYSLFSFTAKKIDKERISLFLVAVFGILFLAAASRQITGEQLPYCAPLVIIPALFILEKIFIWSKRKKEVFLAAWVPAFIISVFFCFLIKSGSFALIKGTIERYASINKSPGERFRRFIYGQSHPIQEAASLTGRWQRLDIERARGLYVPEEQAEVLTKVVDFIQKNTSSNEAIFVFPHEGQYFFLTNRPSPTRIVPVISAEMRPEYQEEVIRDLERSKPRYCIYIQDAQIIPSAKGDIPNELLINLIYRYMTENYRVIRQYNRTFILKKR